MSKSDMKDLKQEELQPKNNDSQENIDSSKKNIEQDKHVYRNVVIPKYQLMNMDIK